MKTKGDCMGRGKCVYDGYAPPHLESEAAVSLYNSKPAIPFALGPRYVGLPPRLKG